MKPVFTKAKQDPRRVIYAEGEDERVLRAVQAIVEEGLAKPILVGRPNVIETRLKRFGLSMRIGREFDLINPEDDPRYRAYVSTYLDIAGRKGVTPDAARTLVRTNTTVIGALAVRRGEADALICGLEGRFDSRVKHIRDIIGLAPGGPRLRGLEPDRDFEGRLLHRRHPCPARSERRGDRRRRDRLRGDRPALRPDPEDRPRQPLGFRGVRHAVGPQDATRLHADPRAGADLEADGEMGADTALSQMIRDRVLPGSRLKGEANVLIMPNLDAANIAFQFSKVLADALPVGPLLLGPAKPAHILTPSVTARGIVNITAAAVVEAQGETVADSMSDTAAETGTPLTSE